MITQKRRFLLASGVVAIGMACVVGCQSWRSSSSPSFSRGDTKSSMTSSLTSDTKGEKKLSSKQIADVQFALGRSLEQRGEVSKAVAAYQEVVKNDSHRADAYLRLAVLHDQRGKVQESARFFEKALQLDPGNPDIFCDRGYSLYLQHHWAEAEMNLRQAITIDPEHARAHNNLGLVLAHTDRLSEGLAEFRRGGCTHAEAHNNLALCMTLERRWDEARANYEVALAGDPGSAVAKDGLRKLDVLIAKLDPPAQRSWTPATSETVQLTSAESSAEEITVLRGRTSVEAPQDSARQAMQDRSADHAE